MKFICKAMLFDFDGTLVDSNVCSEIGWKRWADHNKVSFEHILKVHHGRRPVETISIVAPHLEASKEAGIFLEDQAHLLDGLKPIAGSLKFFNSLPLKAVAIVTSAPALLCLSRLKFVGHRVDMELVSAESVTEGKPDPEGFLLGASRLHVKPEECLVFEDSVAGIQAAKRAGMKVIALQTTHKIHELSEADLIVQSYDELRLETDGQGSYSVILI